ncbi:helix-turn-helix transcriptional regulator [Saccharopolyspora sp. TS4A08]|uniref:Helix-turn-helix transcriptional regulator n=1 Tax=Saccharopolyspora ipomoeae TaxID=3042027 RepID=A0ABT6PTC2_9PSEU|nr:helix-turn-helix transcriptional regulator [Saccharopolyspora sp. TS4A08]MDI2031228.1 helix-turn-helix transcriptional regulator [Saccharopolyspora sp. TS4A08]
MEFVRTSPTFRRRRLARRIRRLREDAGLTQEQAAAALDMSTSALSRKETGEVATSVHEVRSMMDLYDAYDPGLVDLARSAKAKPWWHAYGITSRGYYDLEEEAVAVREWQLGVVPGIFQTEEYARELFVGGGSVELDRLPQITAARMRRKERLSQMTYEAVIEESALLRPIGGADVMRRQLLRLVELAELSTVTIRVLPIRLGLARGLEGSFVLLSYPDPDDLDVLYVEHASGSVHIENPATVQRATLTFERLRAAALNCADSVVRLRELAEAEHGSHESQVAQE